MIELKQEGRALWSTSSHKFDCADTWKEFEEYFVNRFKELFQTSNPQFPSDLDSFISPCISQVEKEEIARIPTGDEIKGPFEYSWKLKTETEN